MNKLTDENKSNVLNSGKVVLKFGASYCGPCRVYDEILKDVPDDSFLYSVDVEEFPEIARQYGVRGIPTTILLNSGVEMRRMVGVQSLDTILSLLKGESIS